jgi:hypothetical protein
VHENLAARQFSAILTDAGDSVLKSLTQPSIPAKTASDKLSALVNAPDRWILWENAVA